jgi:predicted Co/Zn/Cd cation transporter (cation efflux family)
VASVVVGQLWALTVALDAWLGGDEGDVRWLLAFQVASFAVCVAIWSAATRRPR